MAIWYVASGYPTGWITMSKINNVRLPNAAAVQYSSSQVDQLIRSIEQVILQLNSNYTPNITEDKGEAMTWFFSS